MEPKSRIKQWFSGHSNMYWGVFAIVVTITACFLLLQIQKEIDAGYPTFIRIKRAIVENNPQTPPTAPTPNPALAQEKTAGKLENVNNGLITGWAIDPSNSEKKLTIQFYLDKPKGQSGTELYFESETGQVRSDVNKATGLKGNFGFAVAVPKSFGDGSDHSIYAYAVLGNESVLLSGSPKSFNFKTVPVVSLKILSPASGEIIKGSDLTIRYSLEGNRTGIDHTHWQIDDGTEFMDMDLDGTVNIPNLKPGKHTLNGYLAYDHHNKILNTDVSVEFESK